MQLIINRERVVFVRKAQPHLVVCGRKGVELSGPAQHLHFLLDQRRLNTSGKTRANREELIFALQLEAWSNGRGKKRLTQALAGQLTVCLVW